MMKKDKVREDEMRMTCSTHERKEELIYDFGVKDTRKETNRKI
jgi:hypothetical protein